MLTVVRDASEALLTVFANSMGLVFAATPKILGFGVILAISWFIASSISESALLIYVHHER